MFSKLYRPLSLCIRIASSDKVEFVQFSSTKSSRSSELGNFCVVYTCTILVSSGIFCSVELFAVDVTVSGYRSTLLKELSSFADECVPVEEGGNAANSNR
jgi:hypothetical protein